MFLPCVLIFFISGSILTQITKEKISPKITLQVYSSFKQKKNQIVKML